VAITEHEAAGPIMIFHNGWEHRNGEPGWTCCDSQGTCTCGAPISRDGCGLHFKTSGGIVVG
jgi:hypothetical protein